ncbi:MAG TPA: S53 family peptidase [Streptosporangiaceae bacterium]
MRNKRTLIAVAASAAAIAGMAVAAGGPAGASPAMAAVRLPGSAAPFTGHSQAIGDVAGAAKLTVQVWLKPRITAARSFATSASTPGSSQFRRYLTPAGYTARFAASKATEAKVAGWLASKGFTAIHPDALRSYVRATASTASINAAFGVQMKLYRASAGANAGRYQLRANDRAISVPASLAGSVLGVTGLDNAAPALPLERQRASGSAAARTAGPAAKAPRAPCSVFYGQHTSSALPKHFGITHFPTEVCGYGARQVRSAYGFRPANTGTGQTIALVELGLARGMFQTLQDYAQVNHIHAPSPERYQQLSLGQGTACGDFFDIEEQLDVESSYDVATNANQLVVGGDSCNNGDFGLQGLFDADTAVLGGTGSAHPLATIASNSWESGDEAQPASIDNIEDAILVQAAAEGVGMYFSSGDGSGVEMPSADPFAISVGGTSLGLGSSNNRLFETGWSTGQSFLINKKWDFFGEQGAAGGGPSLLWAQPSYQQGVVPDTLATASGNRPGLVRSVPDIGADADPFTGFAVGLLEFPKKKPPRFVEETFGGTSLAAPLVAGLVADAQQGQPQSFGLINPVLYKLAGTKALHHAPPVTASTPAAFRGVSCDQHTCGIQLLTTFDDQNPNMFGYTGQVALPGYDNMSGLGTPNGPSFIFGLRKG